MTFLRNTICSGTVAALTAVLLSGCTTSNELGTESLIPDYPYLNVFQTEYGIASYYSHKLNGRKTASGERYRKDLYTAAHTKYPFGAVIRVTSLRTGRSVIVRINDRVPPKNRRPLDVSYAAAKQLEMIRSGVVKVKIEVIDWGDSGNL